jgi:hypothetical protein
MRRHELDPISLTFGSAFAALGLLFLLGQADQALRLRWVWPLLLLALGAGILLDIALGRLRKTPDPGVAPGPDPAPVVAPAPDAWSADLEAAAAPAAWPDEPAAAPDPDAWPAEPEAAAAPEARPADPATEPDPEPADPGVEAGPESVAAPEAGPAVDNREHPN